MPGRYTSLVNEKSWPMVPSSGRHHSGCCARTAPPLRQLGPDDHTGVGHTGSIVTSPELCVLAPVFERHKADTHLDVGEHVGDLKAEVVVPLLDGIRGGREFIQDVQPGI